MAVVRMLTVDSRGRARVRGHSPLTTSVGLGRCAVSDASITLAELQSRVARFNQERDWAQFHNPRNLAMSVAVEAGELLELFLWSADDGPQPPVATREPKVNEEVADVLICLLNLCERMGIDPSEAVIGKLAKNAERYPVDKSKGRMEKYGEL